MDATLMEPDACRDAELGAIVAQLREEISQLRREVSGLRSEVGYWKSRHADALKRNEKLERELNQARAEIKNLKADLFGRKSEKQTSRDRSNHLEDPQEEDAKKKKKRGQQPNRPGPKRRDYSQLPVREETIEFPAEQCVCSRCGKPLAEHSRTEDSEQLEIEVEVFRRRLRRKRYQKTCDCPGRRTVTAAKPPKLIPKSRFGTSLWVHLLLEKFHGQRPIQRTIEQLGLHGLKLAPGTIIGGLKRIEPLLEPIHEAIRRRNVQSTYHQADETRWLVFVEKEGKNGHRWWLWVFAGKDTVVYVLDPSRSHAVPEAHFPVAAGGVLMVDRYSAYKAMQQVKVGKLLLAFCWAHVRRDFVRVGKGYRELKEWALAWLRRIRELYRLNRLRMKHEPDCEAFAQAENALRDHVESMRLARDEELADTSLRAPCRGALKSLREHWGGLTLFLEDPRIPLDNNYSERLVRNPALGRKNYYGSGAEWSGRLATRMFSLTATLKLWDLNPREWLLWYLESCAAAGGQPPTDIEQFLPWNLSLERRASLSHPSAAAGTPDSS